MLAIIFKYVLNEYKNITIRNVFYILKKKFTEQYIIADVN